MTPRAISAVKSEKDCMVRALGAEGDVEEEGSIRKSESVLVTAEENQNLLMPTKNRLTTLTHA